MPDLSPVVVLEVGVRPPTSARFLYCLPGDERAYTDPAECYESCLEPFVDDETTTVPGETHVIEKWTVRTAADELPGPDLTIEWVIEHACQEVTEGGVDDWEHAGKLPEVVRAYRAANELLASKVSWLMCDEKVGAHTVTWSATGPPLLDGQPMYVRREGADRLKSCPHYSTDPGSEHMAEDDHPETCAGCGGDPVDGPSCWCPVFGEAVG